MPHRQLERLVGRVESSQGENARAEFARLCNFVVYAVESGTLTMRQAAYRICATASRIPAPMSKDERELMIAAGNLEMPPENQDPTLPGWDELKQMVARVSRTTLPEA